jgi:hypothetical protein
MDSWNITKPRGCAGAQANSAICDYNIFWAACFGVQPFFHNLYFLSFSYSGGYARGQIYLCIYSRANAEYQLTRDILFNTFLIHAILIEFHLPTIP